MIASAQKTVSIIAMSAMLSVSLIGICKQMFIPCVLNCSNVTMSAMRMDAQADGCAQKSASCPTPMKDHLTTFASMYPSVATDAASLPLLIASVAFFFAWFLISNSEFDDREKLRVKFRGVRRRLSNFVSPNFLVFAFSQGILNSKIYASS